MKLEQTTALRKIATLRKKIRVVQGGQGSSKTFSILMLLVNNAAGQPNREILILSAELTKMRLTVIKDFVKVMRGFGIYEEDRFIAGTLYRFPNGSFIKFIGLDKSDVGKGLRSDVAFFNEVNKIDMETYRQVASRAKVVYCDYNPDVEFFIHRDVVPRADANFLILTFNDNESLPKGERDEILRYKELGYNPDGTVLNKYWANKWDVYGLGKTGAIDGAVFEDFEIVPTIPEAARLEYFGCDFGFSNSKTAVVAVYNYNNALYFDQWIYETKLTNQGVAKRLHDLNYRGDIIYCDSAEPKSIRELQVEGINAIACDSKRDIKPFAIQKLNHSTFYVTERSEDLIKELQVYVYDEKTGKPKKSEFDHAMDAILYAVGSDGKYNANY